VRNWIAVTAVQQSSSTKNENKNMTTLHFRKSIGRSRSWRCGFVLVPLALLCFGLLPTAKALLPAPSPDGGYPGGNTAEGDNALHDVNTAVGINNTAVGANALTNDTTGQYNVAVGEAALANNTTGNFNMAIGTEALRDNNANFNLAIGFRVGFMNTTGNHLTGVGAAALRNNTTGNKNTAIGADALRENTTSSGNTAIGADALLNNTTGANDGANTAVGAAALFNNTTGEENVAVGFNALNANVGTGFSVAVGFQALDEATGGQNTAVGDNALGNVTTGSENTALGDLAGFDVTTGSNIIAIGAFVSGISSAFGQMDNSAYIGSSFGQPLDPGTGTTLAIDADGKLGTFLSSRRFKKEIKPMGQSSKTVLALKPVTFQYNYDKKGTPQFGLVAENVAKVNPNLVVRDKNGELVTVRYEQINVMLLNEFLKEHKKVEEQQGNIAELKSTMEVLTAQLKEQAAQIQKVSAQVEMSKPAAKVVKNKQ
jgi:trimeric autotransporter adhesin